MGCSYENQYPCENGQNEESKEWIKGPLDGQF